MEGDLTLLQHYARSGDADAFKELARRYSGYVYGCCLRISGNEHDAEDAAQECFMSLARDASTIVSSLPGWLHRTAVYQSLSVIRRDARRRHRERVAIDKQQNSTDPTWAEVAPYVDQAIEELPAELRHVLLEYYLQERTQEEIASELGVHRSAVSKRVQKALEALRVQLKKAGFVVTAATLAVFLGESVASAAPATLMTALTKMAMAGVGKGATAIGAGAAVSSATGGSMIGALSMKAAVIATAAILAVAGVVWHQRVAGFIDGSEAEHHQQEHVEPLIVPVEEENVADVTNKEEMIELVEDFFQHNFRDVTSRETLEWGKVEIHDDDSRSIRYMYEARIWNKETLVMNQVFTFDWDGTFVRYRDIEGFPKKKERKFANVTSQKGMIELVEDFFQHNFRDITKRETIEWGQVTQDDKGNSSIRYKYLATIWNKDTKVLNQIFTFNPGGKFVSVTDAIDDEARTEPKAQEIVERYGNALAGTESVAMSVRVETRLTETSNGTAKTQDEVWEFVHARDGKNCEWTGRHWTYDDNGNPIMGGSKDFQELTLPDKERHLHTSRPLIQSGSEYQRAYLLKDYRGRSHILLGSVSFGGYLDSRFPGIGTNSNLAEALSENPRTIGMEEIDGEICHIVESRASFGTLTAWIAPKKGYNALRFVLAKKPGDMDDGKSLEEMGYTDLTAVVEDIEMAMIDKTLVPIRGKLTLTFSSTDGRNVTSQVTATRSDVDLNPDFEAMGYFKIKLRDGNPIRDDGSSARYQALDGELVPVVPPK